MRGLGAVVRRSGGVLTASVLAAVYLYAKVGNRLRGAPSPASAESLQSGGSWIAALRTARRTVRLRMRDGSRIKCRLVDTGGLLSVHVDRDYEAPGVAWRQARAIVDVGANVGSFTVWAALKAPNAKILSIEPNPGTFKFLRGNIELNGLQSRVTAMGVAVGPSAGEAMLESVDHSLGTRLSRGGRGEVPVIVETLPALLAQAGMGGHIDVLKIDCEGMEYEVLEAVGQEWLRSVGTLMCEYHPEEGRDVATLDRILRAAGFHVERPDTPVGVIWATR